MATWIRHAGAIMVFGDSLGRGEFGDTGGYRPALSAALTAANIVHRFVGPYNNTGLHASLDGSKASDALADGLVLFLTTYRPHFIIIGKVINDLGTGQTSAQAYVSLETIVSTCRTYCPWAKLIDIDAAKPDASPDPFGYAACRAECDVFNAAHPAWCSGRVDGRVSSPAGAKSDGLHYVDGATGYGLFVTPLYDVIRGLIP